MSKFINDHIETVTPEALDEFRLSWDSFTIFASASGKNGHVQLGFLGDGSYAIRHRGVMSFFSKAEEAIEEYKELLTAVKTENQEL